MRIAHVVRRYARSEWGGTETVVAHTVEEQSRLGHEVRVFCTSALGGDGYPYFYPYWPMPAADRLALDKKGGSPYAPRLLKAVAEFRPDVVHIHCGGRLAAAAVKLAERLGVPSVISLHGGAAAVPPQELANMLKPLKGKFPYGGILDRLLGLRFDPYERASALVAISKEEVTRLSAKFPGQTVAYLPNGVNAPERTAPRRTLPAEGPVNVLCVSRIDYQKNQLALVKALAVMPRLRVRLIGPVTCGWYRDDLLAKARELGVEDRFELVPGLPPDSPELKAAYAAADVFALPSVHEPFGIVALEAWAAGVPLVAARVGGLKDFVRDGENGLLFDPSDDAALPAALRRLTDDPALGPRLAAQASEDVLAYGWPTLVARLIDLYVSLGATNGGQTK